MKVGKPTSKRVPVRLRHKIEKASAAKQRKNKKLAKKNPQWRSRLKKDPGIPNLFPYKDKILHEIEESKRRKEEEAIRRKEEARARRDGVNTTTPNEPISTVNDDDEELLDYDEDEEMDQPAEVGDEINPMAALLASAKAQAAKYDKHEQYTVDQDEDASDWSGMADHDDDQDHIDFGKSKQIDSSRRAYDKQFKSVVATSDVILYVLDARDPEGTRSREVEREVTASPSKRLILILNKIDLIPSSVLKQWLLHLRRSFPTLPLRASSSMSNPNSFTHKQLTHKLTSATLLKCLKAYAATNSTGEKAKHGSITIGVLGYPNVGKSSVVTTLASQLGRHRNNSAIAPVGAEAGLTTSIREVKLDSKLRLLDSPGIVFPSTSPTPRAKAKASSHDAKTDTQAALLLLNAIPTSHPHYADLAIPAISLLLRRLAATTSPSSSPENSSNLLAPLLTQYSIPALLSTASSADADVTTDFLVQVARKRGRLGKGGVPNLHAAAMAVLADWREGRIRGWVEPPKATVESTYDLIDESERQLQNEMQGIQGPGAGDSGAIFVNGDRKEIVQGWAKEFCIEGLWGDGVVGEDGEGDKMMD